MRLLLFILWAMAGAVIAHADADIPVLKLSNSVLRLTVLSPDPNNAFYREARFDHSGIVGFAEANGRVFIGRKQADLPTGEVFSLGTSEEYLNPLPLDDGATFIKIGVGTARAKDTDLRHLELVKALPWIIRRERLAIEFEQSMSDPSGWGYHYLKRVEISPDGPEFLISHSFKNTGQRTIRTDVYCHNWLLLENQGVGPSVRFEFPYDLVSTELSPKQGGHLTERHIAFSPGSTSPPTHPFFAALTWQGNPAANTVALVNQSLGMRVEISGDWVPFKHHIYATANELCPEPFYRLEVEPGGEKRWTATYKFLSKSAIIE